VRTQRFAAATRSARRGVRGRAGLEAVDSDDLVPGPDSDGQGAGSAAQDGVGVVVEWLKGWDDAAPTDPDEGVGEEVAWQFVRQLGARTVPRQRTAGTCKVFEKFLIIASTGISSFCKNSLGNTMGAPKTASAGKRPVSSLGCARSPRSTKGNSSDQVAAAARARRASLRRRCSLSTAPFDSGW
jgi:hypothetical protein